MITKPLYDLARFEVRWLLSEISSLQIYSMAETDSVMVFNLQYHLMTLAHYLVFVSHDSQAQEWGWLDLVVMINVSNSTGEPAPHVVSLNQVLINIIQKAYKSLEKCFCTSDLHCSCSNLWLTASKWISINWIDSLIQGSYHFCFRANLSVIFVWLNESDLTQIMALSMTFFMKSSPYNQFTNSLFISNLRKNQTVMNLIFSALLIFGWYLI